MGKSEYGYFSYISEEQFLALTKKYTNSLFEAANVENAPFFMVDQLVPASNIARYTRYFDDLLAIIVERDPRDLYIREKLGPWLTTPIDSVEDFCSWFQIFV